MSNFIRLIFVFLFLGAFLFYFTFQFRGVLFGPRLVVFTPQNGASFTKSVVAVRGKTQDISTLYLNGRPIFINESGFFEESLIFAQGLNTIELKAKDKFGNILKERRMIYINN